jgi:hypothetical protein
LVGAGFDGGDDRAAPISLWIDASDSARRGMTFMSFSCTSMTTSAEFWGVNRQSDMAQV